MMMHRVILTVAAVGLGLAGGCGAPFLHPAVMPGSTAWDPGLVGEWTSAGETVVRAVISEKSEGAYSAALTIHHKGEFKSSIELDVSLTDIGDARFADLFLARGERDKLVGTYGFLVMPVHQVMKLARDGDHLRVWSFDGDWLERHAGGNGFTSDRLVVGGGEIAVLTAPTAQVRAWIAKNAGNPGAFDPPTEFARVAR
jgi:hypothetical protein